MARLTNSSIGNSNTIMLDVEGTPSFDLPDTEEYEGDEIDLVRNLVSGLYKTPVGWSNQG